MKFLYAICFTFLAMLFSAADLSALEPLILDKTNEKYSLGRHVEILEDREARWAIEDVSGRELSARFKKSGADSPNFGYTRSAIWIKFTITIPENIRDHWYLEIGYPLLDDIRVYEPGSDGRYSERIAGDTRAFDEREIAYQSFIFQLTDRPGTHTFYFRVKTTSSLIISPLTIYSSKGLLAEINLQRILSGIYYGILAIMLAINLVLAAFIRDRAYIYYVLYIAGFLLFSLVQDGNGFQYFWSETLWMNNGAPFFIFFTLTWMILFVREFIVTRKNIPHLDNVLKGLVVVNIIGLPVSVFLDYFIIIQAAALLTLCVGFLLLFTGIVSVARGVRQARFFLISFFFVVLGISISSLNRFAVLPNNAATIWGFQFGIMLQFVMLYIGLADTYNVMQQDKLKAQLEAYQAQKEAAENLEKTVAERTSELREANKKLMELDKVKTNFFANISHEIRTPLTLILSPIESVLQGDFSEPDTAFFRNIQRNAIRLLKLINNLLDFSKIEAGRMTMTVHEVDMVKFLKNYMDAVTSAAESRGINLRYTPEKESIPVFLDVEKIDRIGMNIFSNALKFTEKGGDIALTVRADDVNCYVECSDTGVGIPAGQIDAIFDRFNQADSSSTRKYEGTGIGLALVREYVEMHGGDVSVKSKSIEDYPDDHGSTFTVRIPLGKSHFDDRENVVIVEDGYGFNTEKSRRYTGMRELVDLEIDDIPADNAVHEDQDKPHPVSNEEVLIVEDNPEMRDFLQDLVGRYYRVYTAQNGEEGLRMAKGLKPDLVLSDVMMPVMNGTDMTRELKRDAELRLMPVILLTARRDLTFKLEGLEYGADDYIVKPFNSKELLARIKTLLKTYRYEKMILQRNFEMERDLEVARLLQEKLLPRGIPHIPGFRLHFTYIPMDKVGGDFYDYSQWGVNLDLLIADVSGHGLPGAFLSMMAKMALEGIENRESASAVLQIINDVICRSTVKNNFITAFYCIIDRDTNIMRYSSAGHLPQIVYRKGADVFFELKTKGNPLGWFKEMIIGENSFTFRSGDRLILFTDGITESMGEERVLFEDKRLRSFIREHSDSNPQDFSDELIKQLQIFSGEETFSDDLTLVVLDVE